MKQRKKYKHLSFEERFVIEISLNKGLSIRAIAELLERSPSTISYEINKKSVNGIYDAKKAHKKSGFKRWRAKRQCLKVSMDRFLTRFVERKLKDKWSPKQISGYLSKEYNITCSDKAIYKFVKSRSLERYLFWSWNKKKSGPKRGVWGKADDGRKYIDERPELNGLGHFELDFIVSKQSTWVLLVATDRLTKHSLIDVLPNRKRVTIDYALSSMFSGHLVKSITTDNDIAFNHWVMIEKQLNTSIFFTHPYCSWEKGLVENTNRWIRCFVSKGRDISSVTEKELNEIRSFLNNRPREVIGFRKPMEYYLELLGVRLRG